MWATLIALSLITSCASFFAGDELSFHTNALKLQKQKQFKAAIESYKNAISIDPVYSPLYVNLAWCYMQTGGIDSAKFYLIKALEIEPENAIAKVNLDLCQFLVTKHRIRPPVVSYFYDPKNFDSQIAHCARDGEIDIGLLLAIMKVESNFKIDACSHVGALGLMQLMPGTAREMGLRIPIENEKAKKVVVADPRVDERLHPIRNIEAGSQYIKKLMGYFRSGNRMNLTKTLEAYNRGLGAILKLNPNDRLTQSYSNKVIKEYKYLRQNSRAQKNLLTKIRENWKDFLSQNGLLTKTELKEPSQFNKKEYQTIIHSLRKLAPLLNSPNEKTTLYNDIADIYLYINQLDSSVFYLQKTIGLQKENPFRYAKLARILVTNGENQKALKYYKKAIELDPGLPGAYTAIGELKIILGEISEAEQFLLKSLQLQKENQRALNDLGVLHYIKGNYQTALHYLKDAVLVDSTSFISWYNLTIAQILEAQNKIGFSLGEMGALKVELCDTLRFYNIVENQIERPFDWPVNGGVSITSFFGWRPDPVGRQSFASFEFHTGIDIDGGTGDKIVAPADGVVKYAGWHSGGFGNSLKIEHKINGYTYETGYHHLSKISVKSGDKVKSGDTIGLMGNTGRSTGSHLHFMIYKNGDLVDPLGCLKVIDRYEWRM